MGQYVAPIRDMQFVLHEFLQVEEELKQMPTYADVDADIINQVLEEGGKFTSEVLFPLNHSGDREGCQLRRRHQERDHAEGLQGSLQAVRRRRLGGAGVRSGIRRPGLAGRAEQLVLRNAELVQPGLVHVPGPVARRLRVPAGTRHRRAEGSSTCRSWCRANGPAPCA